MTPTTVNKESVPKSSRQAYEKSFTRVTIVAGFKSTGIHHLNTLTIPKETLSPLDAFDRNKNGQSKNYEHRFEWVLKVFQTTLVQFFNKCDANCFPRKDSTNLEVVVEIHNSAIPSSALTVAGNQGSDNEYAVDFESNQQSINQSDHW